MLYAWEEVGIRLCQKEVSGVGFGENCCSFGSDTSSTRVSHIDSTMSMVWVSGWEVGYSFSLFVVVLCHSNSISVISWW